VQRRSRIGLRGLKALAAFEETSRELYAQADFQQWFGSMMEVTERGERQLLNMERLA
jgi:hypothetical protein